MTSVSPQQYLGRLIDRKYFVIRILGSGGFGTVYLAEQRLFDRVLRRVALKLFHESLVGPSNAHEVFNDAITLILLQQEPAYARFSDSLITVYDAGFLYERPDQAFMVMEYVEGYRAGSGLLLTTLRDLMRAYRPVPEEVALRWMIQICRPIAWMHTLPTPILHCDLKPENVLASGQDRLKIADFGFARLTIDSLAVAPVGGTLGYIPPELLLGSHPAPSADVYMLGMILYEILCGENPLTPSMIESTRSDGSIRSTRAPSLLGDVGSKPSDDLRMRILERQQHPLVIPRQAVSDERRDLLQTIIDRCTEFEPSTRFENASGLLNALQAVACGEGSIPVLRRQAQSPERIAFLISRAKAAAAAPGGWRDAIAICDEGLALDPRAVDAYVVKARAMHTGGSHEEALAVCQVGRQRAGDDPRLFLVMSEIYEDLGEHTIAKRLHERAERTRHNRTG